MAAEEWLIFGGIVFGSIAFTMILFRLFAGTKWAKRRQEAFRKLAQDLGGEYSQTMIARLPEVSAPLKTGRVRIELVTHRHRMPQTLIAFDGFASAVGGLEGKIADVLAVGPGRVGVTRSSTTLAVLIDGVLADRDDFVRVVKEIVGLVTVDPASSAPIQM